VGVQIGVPLQEALRNRGPYTSLLRKSGAQIIPTPDTTFIHFPSGTRTLFEKTPLGSTPGEMSDAPKIVLTISKVGADDERRKVELTMGRQTVDVSDAAVRQLPTGVEFTLFTSNGSVHPDRTIGVSIQQGEQVPHTRIEDRRL
jgi:hypothetical protein